MVSHQLSRGSNGCSCLTSGGRPCKGRGIIGRCGQFGNRASLDKIHEQLWLISCAMLCHSSRHSSKQICSQSRDANSPHAEKRNRRSSESAVVVAALVVVAVVEKQQ